MITSSDISVTAAERAYLFCDSGNQIFPGGIVWHCSSAHRYFDVKPGQYRVTFGLYGSDTKGMPTISTPAVMDDFGNLVGVPQ
jgi:hypothetical protein